MSDATLSIVIGLSALAGFIAGWCGGWLAGQRRLERDLARRMAPPLEPPAVSFRRIDDYVRGEILRSPVRPHR